jgi:hypothetical protein
MIVVVEKGYEGHTGHKVQKGCEWYRERNYLRGNGLAIIRTVVTRDQAKPQQSKGTAEFAVI